MIASFQHSFIFIKTRKTAGTSLEIALGPLCGPRDVVTRLDGIDEIGRMTHGVMQARNFADNQTMAIVKRALLLGDIEKTQAVLRPLPRHRFYNHMPLYEVKQFVPPKFWRSAFKFAVERHPYEKVVSWAFMRMDDKVETLSTFDACVDTAIASLSTDPRLYLVDGKIGVDRLLRYESLDADITSAMTRLGLPPLTLPRAKGHHRKDNRPAREILTLAQRSKIVSAFKLTFDIMGYKA